MNLKPLGERAVLTIAKAEVDPRQVIEIGTLHPETGRLEITARAQDLGWWIDSADLDDLGVNRPLF